MTDVLIGIPTYYGGKLALNCVTSILQWVELPDIRIFQNNIGWLKACNKIMKESTGDIILLNDDCIVTNDIVKPLQELAYSDDRVGIVGAKSLSPSGTVNNYGIYVATDGNTAHKYYGWQDDEVDQVEKQQAVEGSCWYIKRAVINDIGLMDEKYGQGYRAEVDYCFRAREKGWLIKSTPDAKYIHYVSQTMGRLGVTNDTYDIFMQDWGVKLQLGVI